MHTPLLNTFAGLTCFSVQQNKDASPPIFLICPSPPSKATTSSSPQPAQPTAGKPSKPLPPTRHKHSSPIHSLSHEQSTISPDCKRNTSAAYSDRCNIRNGFCKAISCKRHTGRRVRKEHIHKTAANFRNSCWQRIYE